MPGAGGGEQARGRVSVGEGGKGSVGGAGRLHDPVVARLSQNLEVDFVSCDFNVKAVIKEHSYGCLSPACLVLRVPSSLLTTSPWHPRWHSAPSARGRLPQPSWEPPPPQQPLPGHQAHSSVPASCLATSSCPVPSETGLLLGSRRWRCWGRPVPGLQEGRRGLVEANGCRTLTGSC